ncbi:MAG: winged helix-turn-helix transcriptional regulator, partial [Treponema sp.]|nr:winged helix-turn-helix transcriptional regulator [Treponema sp.]
MLTYSFDSIGNKKIYIYLYECIKNDITNNKLKSGDKLPSKRAFAANLGISIVTVESAYVQLQSEG